MGLNRKKHMMLELLIEHYDENFDDPPFYGGLKYYWINEGSKYYMEDGFNILNSLCYTKDVEMFTEDEIPYENYFRITSKGRSSYFEDIYLNKIWWRSKSSWSFIISLIAVVISIISLLIS